MSEHNGDAEGNIGGECSGGEGSRDGGGEEIMATGPSECEMYVLSASYRQGSANNHAPAVLPVVVLGGDEDDALGAATNLRRVAQPHCRENLQPKGINNKDAKEVVKFCSICSVLKVPTTRATGSYMY